MRSNRAFCQLAGQYAVDMFIFHPQLAAEAVHALHPAALDRRDQGRMRVQGPVFTGFNTAAIELLLPTYGEQLGLKGKICKHWTLNPHPHGAVRAGKEDIRAGADVLFHPQLAAEAVHALHPLSNCCYRPTANSSA
jgi:hypothetical protein